MGNTSSSHNINDPVSKIAKPVSKTVGHHKKEHRKTKSIPAKRVTMRAKKLKTDS